MKETRRKIVACFYCHKEFEVHINQPNTKSICPDCKKEGKKSPIISKDIIEKRKKTCQKKYGVEYASQSKEIRKKTEATFMEKYGSKCSLNNEEVKEKSRQTSLRKYGVEDASTSQESKDKRKKTNLDKYGVEYASQSQEIKDKKRKTFIDKYGVDHPMKNREVVEKARNTCLEKYGVDNVAHLKSTKDKKRQTSLRKYGVDSVTQLDSTKEKSKQSWLSKEDGFKNKEIQNKRKQTNLKRYGYDNPSKSPEVINKIKATFDEQYGGHPLRTKESMDKLKATNLEKYGTENPMQSEIVKAKLRKNFLPKVMQTLEFLELEILDEYVNSSTIYKFQCKKCFHIFSRSWQSLLAYGTCPKCHPKNLESKGQREVLSFISGILPNEVINSNTRTIIAPLELDIYIPSKQVAIEYNGLYWHSDEVRTDPKYHLNKTIQCEEKGIQLIHIFEDEWIFKQEIVKARLRQILDVSEAIRIHARQCEILTIDPRTKNEFLDEFHIQGHDSSSIKLGAFFQNELVSVMTFSKPNLSKGQKTKEEGIWELNRFCSNPEYHIPGVASKLLSYFKSHYEWKQIYSYADRRWSTGDLYYKLGFKLDHATQPNYWYLKDFDRIHRFNLRKRPDEPKDIPESVLRLKEGYVKVWDCGSLKFLSILES